MPPGFEGTFGGGEVDGEGAVGVEGAGEVHAEVLAGPEGKGFAVVLVEGAVAVVAGIDAKGEGAVRGFFGALSEGRDGDDGAAADVDGEVGEGGLDHQGMAGCDDAGYGLGFRLGLSFGLWLGFGLGFDLRGVALLEVPGGDFFGAVDAFAGPVVEPDAGREVDFVGSDFFGGWVGGDQDVGAEEELATGIEIDGVAVGGGVGELEEEGTHDGEAGAGGLFGDGVEVGHEAVALFDEAAADGFLFGAVGPGLVGAAAFDGVIAIDGLEGAEFEPLGEEVGWGRTGKAADVGTAEREAAETEVDELRCGHAEMVPGGAVVSGPGGGVTLATGVAGAGEDEGALVGSEIEEAFVGGAGVLHAIDVVDLEVAGGAGLEACARDAMLDIIGHGFGWDVEDGGLVHVIPETGYAVVHEVLIESAPPLATALLSEVGEGGGAGPDGSDVGGAVGVFDEVVACGAGVEGGVAGKFGNVQVSDDDGVEVLFGEVVDHLGEAREVLCVDGEGAVLVLVVDVEIEGVGGEVVGAEAVGDFHELGLVHVAIAGLLKTKGPEGRNGRGAGEPGVGFDYFFRIGAVEEVVVEGAVGGAEGVVVGGLVAEVEEGAEGVVEEDAEGAGGSVVDEEGDGFVDGVGGLLPTEGVGVPHDEGAAGAVEGAGLVAEAEEVRVDGFLLIDGEAGAAPLDGAGVLLEDGSAEVGDGEAEVGGEGDAEGGGLKAGGGGRYLDGGGAGFREDGPGGVFGELAGVGGADAEDVVAEGGDLEDGGSGG